MSWRGIGDGEQSWGEVRSTGMLDETMDLREKSVTVVNDRYMRPESAYMRKDICGNIVHGQHEG